jgi:RNA polymerase sigma-70 factor (ECF subfamily)
VEESDEQLLSAWRGGDARAGERLVDRHFRLVSRFFRNKADHGIDDLIQQTFLGLLEARDRFRGENSFRSFLIGVAFNVLRNHYRRQRADAERLDFGVTSMHDLAPRPSEILAQRGEQRVLLEALRRIPVEHQVLLELYFFEALPAPEIAEILAVPVGTVRTRIRRAKQLLESEIGRQEGSPQVLRSTLADLEGWARSIRDKLRA